MDLQPWRVVPASLRELSVWGGPLSAFLHPRLGPARLRPGRTRRWSFFLDLARRSLVRLPRSQIPLPKVELCRANLHAYAIHHVNSDLACPHRSCLVASLYFASAFSPFLFTCAPQPVSLVCPQLCPSVHLSLPVTWLGSSYLLCGPDPPLRACPQTASSAKLF